MKNNRRCIGVTGTNASGKGEVTEFLQQHGFTPLSLSDVLREIVRDQGYPTDRVHLTRIGQEQRMEHGSGFLAMRVLDKMDDQTSYVIDSIRHPEEVKHLKDALPSFVMWAVDADPQIRFDRSRVRGREENAPTLEAFLEQEQKEMTQNPHAQQLHEVMKLADETILNNGDREELHAQLKTLLARI